MRSRQIVFSLVLAVILGTGCAYKRTQLRVHTDTPPRAVYAEPHSAESIREGDGTEILEQMTPDYTLRGPDEPTYGRIWNNSQHPLTVHLPPDIQVCTGGCPRQYDAMRGIDDKQWGWTDFLPIKPGDKSPWLRASPNDYHVYYDYTKGRHEHRGRMVIRTDYTPRDHMCRGDIVDWFYEIGGRFCR